MGIVLSREGITQKELAMRLGVSQANVSKKFKHNDWRESDVREICDIAGVQCEMVFRFRDGTVI